MEVLSRRDFGIYRVEPVVYFNGHKVKPVVAIEIVHRFGYTYGEFPIASIVLPPIDELAELPLLTPVSIFADIYYRGKQKIKRKKKASEVEEELKSPILLFQGFPVSIEFRGDSTVVTVVDVSYLLTKLQAALLNFSEGERGVLQQLVGTIVFEISGGEKKELNLQNNAFQAVVTAGYIKELLTDYVQATKRLHGFVQYYPHIYSFFIEPLNIHRCFMFYIDSANDPKISEFYILAELLRDYRTQPLQRQNFYQLIYSLAQVLFLLPASTTPRAFYESGRIIYYCPISLFFLPPLFDAPVLDTHVLPGDYFNVESYLLDKREKYTRGVAVTSMFGLNIPATVLNQCTESTERHAVLAPYWLNAEVEAKLQTISGEQASSYFYAIVKETFTEEEVMDGVNLKLDLMDIPTERLYYDAIASTPPEETKPAQTGELKQMGRAELLEHFKRLIHYRFEWDEVQKKIIRARGVFSPQLVPGMRVMIDEPNIIYTGLLVTVIHHIGDDGAYTEITMIDGRKIKKTEILKAAFTYKAGKTQPKRPFEVEAHYKFPWDMGKTLFLPKTDATLFREFVQGMFDSDYLPFPKQEGLEYFRAVSCSDLYSYFNKILSSAKYVRECDYVFEDKSKFPDASLAQKRKDKIAEIVKIINSTEMRKIE